MPLTDSAIRALKPRGGSYKVADEKGIYVEVTPSCGRLWRVKFRAPGGTEKKLALGAYPEITLRAARELRDEARMDRPKLEFPGFDPPAGRLRRRGSCGRSGP
jgi:hypothetical protein